MANTRTPAKKKPPTLADVLAVTTPAERVVSLCVAGDLFAEHQRLEAELEKAHDDGISTRKLNEESPVHKIAKQIQALEAKMAKHTFDFRFRALRKHEWSTLMTAHGPRDDSDVDDRFGFNMETFPPAAVRACCVSPDGMDADEFDGFWETLNSGQRDRLFFRGAWAVNQEGVSVPKSVTASAALQSSEPS
jgi:hypothetical protein